MAQPLFLDDLNPPEPVAPYGFPAREAVCAKLARGMSQELRERGVLAMSLFGSVAIQSLFIDMPRSPHSCISKG